MPLWMWLAWRFTQNKQLIVAIVDKTVLNTQDQEHISLNWVLTHERFTKNKAELYDRKHDYFGFFPAPNEKFSIKGLERFNDKQLQQLSTAADAVYFTDAYGIYRNEWYARGNIAERSGIIYGGMSDEDLYFLTQMKAQHKLIITEFNCLGSPTRESARDEFARQFGIHWTGWIGRYFGSLDTNVNHELPPWLIHNYKNQHNGRWPFTKAGIAFVHNDDRVVILEDQTQLIDPLPHIIAIQEGKQHYGLPGSIKYSFWFDVIQADTSFTHSLASFAIDANETGKKELAAAGIPTGFPAITTHINNDYRFFYFSADFCDNPIGMGTSYFKGIQYLQFLLYNSRDPEERVSFFWKVYRPLVTRILYDYRNQQ